ncbi:leucyl aminopeptidase [bacterium]|nr:leucyl aminopeptidase [bacterium]
MRLKAVQSISTSYKELVVIPLFENELKKINWIKKIDGNLFGRVKNIIDSGDFKGKFLSSLTLYRDAKVFKRMILIGAGKKREINQEKLRKLIASADNSAQSFNIKSYTVLLNPFVPFTISNYGAGRVFAEALVLSRFNFKKFKSGKNKSDDKDKKDINVCFVGVPRGDFKKGLLYGQIIADNVNIVRKIVNTPSNALIPESIAEEARNICKNIPALNCTVFDEKELEKRAMNGILSVGKASVNPPRFIIIDYTPEEKKEDKPIVVVGKGVSFDSGGISLKPPGGMEKMKYDMAGAGAVLGIMKSMAELKLPQRVVGLIPTAENMPGGKAYKPGDVITMASEITVEVISTDAEGRMILADALHYASTEYKPKAIIDMATLTGACMVALGNKAIAVMGNNRGLIRRIIKHSENSGERVWELPMWDDYDDMIKSETADIKNSGGPGAGTIVGGVFLRKFVKNAPWAHLDIASTAWVDGNKKGYLCKGATGAGVRLLCEIIRHWNN